MLIAPSVIKFCLKKLVCIKEDIDIFNGSDFSIEVFDNESVIVRAVPAIGFDTDWNSRPDGRPFFFTVTKVDFEKSIDIKWNSPRVTKN